MYVIAFFLQTFHISLNSGVSLLYYKWKSQKKNPCSNANAKWL